MKRIARTHFNIAPPPKFSLSNKRTAEERIAINKDKLYITLDALHWEQTGSATPMEKKIYGVSQAYAGNDNGDFFEGGRNVVWACRNQECSNKQDRLASKGTFRFLKYEDKDCCPHCGSKDIYDWEKETFQTTGELLAKTQDGRYRYETWKGEPVNVNHDDKREVGEIEDVWPEPHRKAIVELVAIDRSGPHNNEILCRKIEAKQVDSGSMELLTGIGMCSNCFNVHHSEDDFCDCLKHEKGLVNQRTGMHVFEICKSISGCGHAIIATGDPADSGALVRQVLAGKKEDQKLTQNNTNFNHDMANEKIDTRAAKPVVDKKAARKPNLERVGQRSGDAAAASYSEKPLPAMSDMSAQLKAFGNYDSARTAEDIRLASMTPAERADWDEFQSFKQGKKVKASPSIALQPTLRVNKEFVLGVIRSASKTRKLSSANLASAISNLTLDREDFTKALASRRLPANTLSRLGMRKATLIDPGELEETIMDLIADALIESGERMKSQVSDTTYDDAFDGASELSEQPITDLIAEIEAPDDEDEKNDIPLDKGIPKDDEDEGKEEDVDEGKEEKDPTVIHTDEDKEDFKPEDKSQENEEEKDSSDSLEEKSMKDTKREAQKTETFPEAKKHQPEKAPAQRSVKTEDEPNVDHKSNLPSKVSTTLKIALQRRAQALEASIEKGDGNLDTLVSEHTKVTAQLEKLDSLGGNGLDENPKPVEHVDSKKTLTSEDTPSKPEDLGGNGLDENPRPVKHVAQRKELKAAWNRVKASITNPSSVSAKDIAFLKECGILPKDFKAVQALPKATVLDTEEFPEEANDAQGDIKTAQKDFSKADKKLIENENVEKKTAPGDGLKDEGEHKGWEDKTKPGAALDKVPEEYGWTTPTALKENDKTMAEETGQVEGKELSTKVKSDESKQESDLGWKDKTKPGAAIKDEPKNLGWERSAQLTADYTEPTTPGSLGSSNWTVFADGEPVLRVALKHAYPGEVVKRKAQFASEEYASSLLDAIRDQGVETVHTAEFGGQSKLFTPEERKAMRKAQVNPTPTATNVPQGADASVDPAVADKILNDAKPGIGIVQLLASLLAPVIAESDSLSVASFMEDLVGIGQNQDKVTELTTKLNSNVETIKNQAGLPDEAPADVEASEQPVTEGAPGPVTTPPAAAPNPQVVQAMKPVNDAERRWALKLQASRIEPIVMEEQACGLIPGATHFHANEGLSRKASSLKAKEVVQERVAELMALPEEAYLMVEREIRTACRKIKAERIAKADPKIEARRARWAQMKSDAGSASIMEGMDPAAVEAKSDPKEDTKIALSFKSAGGITRDKLKAAMEARDNRGTRRD